VRKVVISLGGSILVKDDNDAGYIKELIEALKVFDDEFRFIIITGGGRIARRYIEIGRSTGADEATLDSIGIQATRLNAWLMIGALKGESVYPRPVTTLEEALISASNHRFTIGGGTHPGHTTDAVSALIAEMWGADKFLNLTAVDGAYTSDPNDDPKAVRIPKMTTAELYNLVSSTTRGAGSHSVLDPLAAAVVDRAGINTFILEGRDISNLTECIKGNDFHGTVVIPGR
jgi:uridylate kinase